MSPKPFFRVIAFLMLLPGHLVFSQQKDSTDYYALSLEELMNIPITTASKFQQSIKDAPSTVSLITKDQIYQYGWLSGNEVLARLPGFSPSQDYDRMTISSRGIYEGWNNNHMLMLVDGVPMNDNMYGTAFTWEITPMVFTKSLEIIRGPGSALYGSNATNGVISYNTLSAKDMTKKAELRYRIGSKGTQVLDLLTGHENESVSFVTAFNYFQTDGDEYNSLDLTGSEKTISNKRSNYYLFTKIEPKGKLEGLSFQYHEQAWNFNTGHGWLFYVPDKPENMNENRRLISLKYKTPDTDKVFQQEYLIRYQRHGVDWNTRLYPNGIEGLQFGLTEILKTHTSDFFTRMQWSASLSESFVLLGGIENSIFKYNGDELHLSNVNLNTDYSQTENNELIDVGDYFAWLGNNPFLNTGAFVQLSSDFFDKKLKATLGGRYDYSSFKYFDLDELNQKESKHYNKFSPRLSLVYSATEKLSIKAMAGRAFRTPAASELFGRNTYLLASNIKNLRPELINTLEVATDYSITNNLNWRVNLYRTEFNDEIAYSGDNNLSTNLFSLTTVGFENELSFKAGSIDGFLNYSYAQRQNEKIIDSGISLSKSELTWVPQHLLNLGLKYNKDDLSVALQSHYQGQVKRRDSDRDPSVDGIRGNNVESWITLDLRAVYKINENFELGIVSTNLTDTKGMLMKYTSMPFDYQIPGRSILLDLKIMF